MEGFWKKETERTAGWGGPKKMGEFYTAYKSSCSSITSHKNKTNKQTKKQTTTIKHTHAHTHTQQRMFLDVVYER